jgi:hypothetical protein
VKYADVVQAPPGGVTDAEWLRELKVGDALDCLDKSKRWRIAKVTDVCDGDTLTVSFKGWSSKHNETLPRSSPRIARTGSQTAGGKESRVPRRQGDAFCIDLDLLASLEMRIEDFMAGEFPVDEQVCHKFTLESSNLSHVANRSALFLLHVVAARCLFSRASFLCMSKRFSHPSWIQKNCKSV